ncbi:MAG: glycosyltransferase [Campylobacterota bacterium]|nr:glycosyltransferase [Campylobacterota bacterium]
MVITVSVIIPAYNRVNTLARAIESVLNQTRKAEEIIVVDDGSTDATSEVAKMYPEVLLLRQKNMGVSSARNNGIMMASSDWIAFLDSDDSWHPDKLARQMTLHKKEPDLKISYTDERWIRNGAEVSLPKKYCKPAKTTFMNSLEYCNIAPSSVVVHRSLLERVGLFDEALEVCEDYDLWLRVLAKYEVGLISEKLIDKYGGHDDQLSLKHWGMDRFRARALEKHLDGDDDSIVRQVLIGKYEQLHAGALKYKRFEDAAHYGARIEQLKAGY